MQRPMKLYQHPFSSNARKAVMTAKLLGIELDYELVDLASGAQRNPEFLALNPNGMVPVLVDDDFVLWESNAITTYLADTKPGNTLYPSERKARANVDRWLFWAANHWGPAISILSFENMLKKMLGLGDPDPAQLERGETFFKKFAGVLDAHLAANHWVAGDVMTLADITLAAPLMYTQMAKLPVEGFANIKTWLERVQALDAWKQTAPPM